MIRNLRNRLLLAILSTLAAIGMVYLLIYSFQIEVIDVVQYLNGLMAMMVLVIALSGLAIFYYIDLIKLAFGQSRHIAIPQKKTN